MAIMKRNYMTSENIRQGLNAYVLACRETEAEDDQKFDYLYITKGKIHKALRLVNMSISENIFSKWFEHVKSNIEWSKKERREFERVHKQARVEIPFIMPHEFLFLLCNTLSRLEMIKKLHKPDLSSKLGDVYQWEISDGKPMKQMQELRQIRHLHLLNKDAFSDKAPHKMVAQQLNTEAENKRLIYIGMKPQPKTQEISKESQAERERMQQRLSFDAKEVKAQNSKSKEQVKTFDAKRNDRMLEYNKQFRDMNSGGRWSRDDKSRKENRKECIGDLMAVQNDIESTILKAKRIYGTYEEHYKYGHMNGDDYDDDDHFHGILEARKKEHSPGKNRQSVSNSRTLAAGQAGTALSRAKSSVGHGMSPAKTYQNTEPTQPGKKAITQSEKQYIRPQTAN